VKNLLGLLGFVALTACSDKVTKWSREITGGDPEHGRTVLTSYGCSACHQIPGVPGAVALTAPPLIGISQRSYLAGMLQNTPENLMLWIQHPRQVNPHTAMPEQGVSNQDARDMAAYLYSTR
jgi:cytochrome c2